MLKRIITGIVSILIFIPVCIASHFEGWDIVFPIAISILSAIGVFEMSKCLGYHKNLVLTIPMYIAALGLPLLRYIQVQIGASNRDFLGIAMLVMFAILIFDLAYVMFRKNKDKITDIVTFFGLNLYVIGCFSSIYMVRTGKDGDLMYLLVFIGPWVCDTFAYFTGKLLGKHKLIEEISPKKTVEGSIGGVLFTIIAFIVFGLIVNANGADFNYIKLGILGLVASVVSQIGDLIASAVKRQYNVKDYGFIFPGHGGVLDRFDSVLLTAPIIFILNTLLVF